MFDLQRAKYTEPNIQNQILSIKPKKHINQTNSTKLNPWNQIDRELK